MNGYSYWAAALAGLPHDTPPVDQPQAGFFRTVNGDPVCYFPDPAFADDGDAEIPSAPNLDAPLICVRAENGRRRELSHQQALEMWPWVSANPVSEAAWRTAAAGGDWPDEAPGLGRNRPEAEATPGERIANVVGAARAWLDDTPEVTDQTLADQASHYLNELRRLSVDIEEIERRAKKPYNDFLDQIRARYRAIRAPADELVTAIKARLKPFMDEIDRRQRAEREAAKAAAQAAAAEGKRAPADGVPQTRVGRKGHGTTMRTYYSAKIADPLAAWDACADHPAARDLVQQIANAKAREAGSKGDLALLLPGTELVEERRI